MDWLTAASIIAEIGVDMDVFGTAAAPRRLGRGLPGEPRERGQAEGRGTRRGNPFLKAALFAAAVSAARTKGSTYLRDKYNRLRARMGAKKAAMAVAHKLLVAAFHMLNTATRSPTSGPATSTASTSAPPPSASSIASASSATRSCFGPRPQADLHHAPPPVSAGTTRANFRASHS